MLVPDRVSIKLRASAVRPDGTEPCRVVEAPQGRHRLAPLATALAALVAPAVYTACHPRRDRDRRSFPPTLVSPGAATLCRQPHLQSGAAVARRPTNYPSQGVRRYTTSAERL